MKNSQVADPATRSALAFDCLIHKYQIKQREARLPDKILGASMWITIESQNPDCKSPSLKKFFELLWERYEWMMIAGVEWLLGRRSSISTKEGAGKTKLAVENIKNTFQPRAGAHSRLHIRHAPAPPHPCCNHSRNHCNR